MLLSVLELSIPARFKALLSVIATAIVLMAGILNGQSVDRAADCFLKNCSLENRILENGFNELIVLNELTVLSELKLDLPHSSEKEGESEKDVELEADTLSLLDAALKTDKRITHDRCASAKPGAFLPLRSREVERELFRPPQRV